MKDKDTPLRLVRTWAKKAPDCYEALDTCLAAKDSGEICWPDYCRLPINAAFTYLVSRGCSELSAANGAAELTACWLWKSCKVIYAFDADLAVTLAAQADDLRDTDVLPADLLLHPPHAGMYIKAPGILEHTDGFFIWPDYDTNRGGAELRVQWVVDGMEHTVPQVMHIIPGGTIGECIRDTLRVTRENLTRPGLETHRLPYDEIASVARIILSALQLYLYLVSIGAEIEEAPNNPAPRHSGNPQKKRKKAQAYKAGDVKVFDVGIRIGAAIRKTRRPLASASTSGENAGSAKRPHVRRGHWHHYWSGPKDGERELILKWTAPTAIHPEQGRDEIVIFPVKGERNC